MHYSDYFRYCYDPAQETELDAIPFDDWPEDEEPEELDFDEYRELFGDEAFDD